MKRKLIISTLAAIYCALVLLGSFWFGGFNWSDRDILTGYTFFVICFLVTATFALAYHQTGEERG